MNSKSLPTRPRDTNLAYRNTPNASQQACTPLFLLIWEFLKIKIVLVLSNDLFSIFTVFIHWIRVSPIRSRPMYSYSGVLLDPYILAHVNINYSSDRTSMSRRGTEFSLSNSTSFGNSSPSSKTIAWVTSLTLQFSHRWVELTFWLSSEIRWIKPFSSDG